MSGLIGGAGSKSGMISETELDYEEGEWTPASSNGGWTIGSLVKNRYVRIGNICHLYFFFYLPASGSGNITGSGLPFTPKATHYPGGICYTDAGITTISLRIESPSWAIRTFHNDAYVDCSSMNGDYVGGGVTYQIA